MTAPFKVLAGYRFAQTRVGDTLPVIAARELGDASQWADLATINGLVPPYFTADPDAVSAGVKLYGQEILIPAATIQANPTIDPAQVFGTDLALTQGRLGVDDTGDLLLVSGVPNLRQAILNRINTGLGELLFHLSYGCGARAIVGAVSGPTSALLAGRYVRAALTADPRIAAVPNVNVSVVGDAIAVEAEVQPVTGRVLNIASPLK